MNNEHVKGGMNQTKGRVKEEVGHLAGNDKLESEGIIDRMKGKVQEAAGDVKDAAKKVVDTVLSHHKKSA